VLNSTQFMHEKFCTSTYERHGAQHLDGPQFAGLAEVSAATGRASEQLLTGQPAAEAGEAAAAEPGRDLSRIRERELAAELLVSSGPIGVQSAICS